MKLYLHSYIHRLAVVLSEARLPCTYKIVRFSHYCMFKSKLCVCLKMIVFTNDGVYGYHTMPYLLLISAQAFL